jgi:hypothetical protein
MRDSSGRFTKAPKRTLESEVADCYWMLQELKRDLKGMRGELNERLRLVELHLEGLQGFRQLQWTEQQRKAFLSGLRS